MAKVEERTYVEDVEVEYALTSSTQRGRKARFKRGRLLAITKDKFELGSREAFLAGDKLTLTVHTKRVENFLTVDGEVESSRRVSVLKQPAFAVEINYGKLTTAQSNQIAWCASQYAPKDSRPERVIRRDTPVPEAEEAEKPAAEKSAAEAPAKAAPAKAKATPATTAAAARGADVKRPVALLELITTLDKFEVTDDLIWAVIEAAEAGMDVEVLFPGSKPSAEEQEAEAVAGSAAPSAAEARPINVYRLSSTTSLHFSEQGMPASPPAHMFYYSGLSAPEKCFGIELGVDTMEHDGRPSFKQGTVLVFSTAEEVQDGDYAFLKVRGNDMVAQVFYPDAKDVRVRFLNPAWPEEKAARREVRVMCKLVGRYEAM